MGWGGGGGGGDSKLARKLVEEEGRRLGVQRGSASSRGRALWHAHAPPCLPSTHSNLFSPHYDAWVPTARLF
jgi:hypothetical protein